MEMLQDMEVSNLTLCFKIKLAKIADKHPKLKDSSVIKFFFKDYLKKIKEICKKDRVEFN